MIAEWYAAGLCAVFVVNIREKIEPVIFWTAGLCRISAAFFLCRYTCATLLLLRIHAPHCVR